MSDTSVQSPDSNNSIRTMGWFAATCGVCLAAVDHIQRGLCLCVSGLAQGGGVVAVHHVGLQPG